MLITQNKNIAKPKSSKHIIYFWDLSGPKTSPDHEDNE